MNNELEKETIAFKMHLLPGKALEYKARHDEIWPELKSLLSDSGISDYSIFLDEETNILFGTYRASKNNQIKLLPLNPVMQKWWNFMADIMETNPDNEPLSTPLKPVFYME